MMIMSIAMSSPDRIRESVSAFSETAQGVADLRLHGQVERTVDSLVAYCRFMHGHSRTGRELIERIKTTPVETASYLDPEDQLINALEEMIGRYEQHLDHMANKRETIDRDARLNASHCDMLHSAYEEYLTTLSALNEVVKDMRDAIVDHDLAAEPRGQRVYRDIDRLRAALLA